jgi:hypothetical protein
MHMTTTTVPFRALRATKIAPTTRWTRPPKPVKPRRPCRSRNRLRYGGLTRVIISTVAGSGRISPRDLADTLRDRGVRVTPHHMTTRLMELAREGRIVKVGPGVYTKA